MNTRVLAPNSLLITQAVFSVEILFLLKHFLCIRWRLDPNALFYIWKTYDSRKTLLSMTFLPFLIYYRSREPFVYAVAKFPSRAATVVWTRGMDQPVHA